MLHQKLAAVEGVKEMLRDGRRRYEVWLRVDPECVESRGGQLLICLDFDRESEAEKFLEEVS